MRARGEVIVNPTYKDITALAPISFYKEKSALSVAGLHIAKFWTAPLSNFLHFRAVFWEIWQNNRLVSPWGWRPRLGNPGSATVYLLSVRIYTLTDPRRRTSPSPTLFLSEDMQGLAINEKSVYVQEFQCLCNTNTFYHFTILFKLLFKDMENSSNGVANPTTKF